MTAIRSLRTTFDTPRFSACGKSVLLSCAQDVEHPPSEKLTTRREVLRVMGLGVPMARAAAFVVLSRCKARSTRKSWK